ncbi:MAG: VWA domain-containing protein [Sulfurimonas sp.]|nr:VWA domain-containing protein [Sulfurimonas sp.]MDQ7062454.1 VWA domain-containing protein [Sulfurimonas sp.]
MSFLNPEYFWLLLLLIPVFIKKNYKEISSIIYGYMITFVFIVLAMTRLVLEQEPIKTNQVLSDVIIAVDLSSSMGATDIKPSRLEKAKEVLKKLVKSDTSTRYAVLGFTTNAIVLSPLTEDSELLIHLYDSMDGNMIITKGSSIMSALELSSKMSKSKSPSLVILSDGADALSYVDEAKFAKDRGLIVNVFMLATKMGGTLDADDGALLKDEIGNIVISRENDAIQLLPHETGGAYTKNYDELLSALDAQKNTDYKTKTMIIQNMEFFYYFIVLALLSFLVATTTLKRYMLVFLLLLGIHADASINGEYIENAFSAYKEGEYDKALVNYEMVRSADAATKSLVFYNIGTTYIRLKEFKKAREAFLKSLTLKYSLEADENMRNVIDAQEQMQMSTGQEKTDKKSSYARPEVNTSKKKSKKGGTSNMKVQAPAGSGKAEMGEKTKADGMMNLNKSNAKLSSKQYELINKGNVNEKKPW